MISMMGLTKNVPRVLVQRNYRAEVLLLCIFVHRTIVNEVCRMQEDIRVAAVVYEGPIPSSHVSSIYIDFAFPDM